MMRLWEYRYGCVAHYWMSENRVRQACGRVVLACIVKKISNEPPESSVRLHNLVTSLKTNRGQGPIALRQLPEAYLTCSSLLVFLYSMPSITHLLMILSNGRKQHTNQFLATKFRNRCFRIVHKVSTVHMSRDPSRSTQQPSHTITALSYHHRQPSAPRSSVPPPSVDSQPSPKPQ